MGSPHKVLYDIHRAMSELGPSLDPGDAGTINCERYHDRYSLVSAGAETRTLAQPTAYGQRVLIDMRTDGGDITMTVTGGFDEAGNTSLTFDDVGQYIELESVAVSTTAFQWRVVGYDGVAGPAVDMGSGSFSSISSSGNLTFSAAADIVMPAATAAALEVSDGTTKFLAFDTRVTTVGVTTVAIDISDYTLASASGAVATAFGIAAHTLNYTGTTQVTTQVDTVSIGARSLVGAASVTVDEANSLHAVPPTEGSMVTLTAASAIRISNAGGTPTNQYGIYIEDLTSGATADVGVYIAGADTYAIHVASADPVHLGTAGTATGVLQMAGATSGVVTMTVADAAGTWSLTLPTGDGCCGQQLATNGSGVTSWTAAASLSQYKDVGDELDPAYALERILATPVHRFRYKKDAENSTGDFDTEYTGIMGDSAPELMHYNGTIFSPVSAHGYTAGAIKALEARIRQLEQN